jgi:hypothetical protein
MRNFLVAATSRSGTTYTAMALSRLGFRCGHEQVFSPWKPWGFRGWGDFDGDSSCYAVPYLHQLPGETLIIHQVRDPLAVIRSIANWGIFRSFSPGRTLVMPIIRMYRGKPPRELGETFMRAHSKLASARRDGELARTAQHWIEWNVAIEASCGALGLNHVLVRVEDLHGKQLNDIADLIGGHHASAPDRMDTSVNAGSTSRYSSVSLEDLPDDLRLPLKQMAVRYGYGHYA